MKVSRRGLLIGSAVGGGLLVAWYLSPREFPNPLPPVNGEHAFDAGYILRVVQFPELATACLDLDAQNMRTAFKETQLLKAFELFERTGCPARISCQ